MEKHKDTSTYCPNTQKTCITISTEGAKLTALVSFHSTFTYTIKEQIFPSIYIFFNTSWVMVHHKILNFELNLNWMNKVEVSNLIAEKKGSALPERVLIDCHCIICNLDTTYITIFFLIQTSLKNQFRTITFSYLFQFSIQGLRLPINPHKLTPWTR